MSKYNRRIREWYREIEIAPGIFEFFLTFRADSPGLKDFDRILNSINDRLTWISEGISATVFHTIGSDVADAFLAKLRNLVPVAEIGGRGDAPFSLSINGYRFSTEPLRTSAFERPNFWGIVATTTLTTESFIKTTLDAYVSGGASFEKQIDDFYAVVGSVLERQNIPPSDFVRSWNFIDSILSRYGEFNAVRDRNFSDLGIVAPPYPAGTGIDCRLAGGAKMCAFAEFHSPGAVASPKIRHYKTPVQCEAVSYGPKFSRATSVESGGIRRIHVSGTASVSPNGETLNADDIEKNVCHAMETVRELLDLAGADFSNVVRSYAYFKNSDFVPVLAEWQKSRGIPDFPCAFNVCDVCRDDWLFEFECVAFVPVKKTNFGIFWKAGEEIGNKAKNCQTLAEEGFPVPKSLAVSWASVARISQSQVECNRFLNVVVETFGPSALLAVRSSSSSEDGLSISGAWAFTSVMAVPVSELLSAVSLVRHSFESAKIQSPYGVLIQEYFPLKTFWVCFTCDPEFGRHAMVAEVSDGKGEDLVSGKNLPDRISFSRNGTLPKKAFFHGIDWESWRKVFRRIESVFSIPQDIEWGVDASWNGVLLQSRPITTLSKPQISSMRALDRLEIERGFGNGGAYRLVRNELSEIFGSPDVRELAFLRRLYASNAVISAYGRLKISYVPKGFLTVAGGFLYIDEAAERSCFDGGPTLAGKFIGIRNAWRFGSLRSKLRFSTNADFSDLETRLLRAVEASLEALDSEVPLSETEIVDAFYSPVFEANLLASIERGNASDPTASAKVQYSGADPSLWEKAIKKSVSAGLRGNSLSFNDDSPFITPLSEHGRFSESASGASSEPDVRSRFDFYREVGRIVSVTISNLIRKNIGLSDGTGKTLSVSPPADPRIPESLDFAFFETRLSGASSWNMISSGAAAWKFVTLEEFEDFKMDKEGLIVLVNVLDPSFVSRLDGASAIVSRTGGSLSHFAIVAREKGLPIFVSTAPNLKDFLGKNVAVSVAGIEIIGQ